VIQLGGKYCTIFSEFGVPLKLVTLIKICLNETHIKVSIGQHLSDNFPIQNGIKQDVLAPLFFYFALEYANRKAHENRN
jgi:hypothetical protein